MNSLPGYYDCEHAYNLNFCLCIALVRRFVKNTLSDFHKSFYKEYVECCLEEDTIFCLFEYFSCKKYFNFDVENASTTNTEHLYLNFREDVYKFLVYEHFYYYHLDFSPFGGSIVNKFEDLFVYEDFAFTERLDCFLFHSTESNEVFLGDLDILSTPQNLMELDQEISKRIYQFRLRGLLNVGSIEEAKSLIFFRE